MEKFNWYPKEGSIVSLSHNGLYLGRVMEVKKNLGLVYAPKKWELFTVEYDERQIALKQVESGLYVGGYAEEDETPQLVQQRSSFELFNFEGHYNYVLIKNQKGCYLVVQQKKLIWTKSPNHDQKLWTFHIWKQGQDYTSEEDKAANIQELSYYPEINQEFAIQKYCSYIGGVMECEQTLVMKEENKSYQKFLLMRHIDGLFSFIQKVSNLFLGGQVGDGQSPRLVKRLTRKQKFILQRQQNGTYNIFSQPGGTYLTFDGQKLTWKQQPTDENQFFQFEWNKE